MHLIRIHGPWMAQVDSSEPRRVHLPRDWEATCHAAQSTRLTLTRRFHRPTGLDSSTQVLLAIPSHWKNASVVLNGKPLGIVQDANELRRFDISTIVQTQEAHDLQIQFPAGAMPPDAPYLLTLEIHEATS